MGNFLSLPLLAIAAALQSSVVPEIRLLGGGPDLVFLLVLSWSINSKVESGVVWAFVGGICQDLLSAAPTGASALGMLALVFGISGLGQQVYQIGFVVLVGLVLVGTFVKQFALMFVLWMAGFHVSWLQSLSYVVIPTMFYNLVLIWPVYWFVRRIQRRLERSTGSLSY